MNKAPTFENQQQLNKEKWNRQKKLIYSVFFIVFLIFTVPYVQKVVFPSSQHHFLFNNTIGIVKTVHWDYKDPLFLEQIIYNRRPVIIKNSTVKDWKAFKEWTPSYLATHVPGKFVARNISYADDENDDFLNEMKFKDIVEHPEANLHYNGLLRHWGPELMKDITPYDQFQPRVAAPITPMTWVGHQGVHARLHYDLSTTIFVQLHGRKTFTIFSPEQWWRLYTFADTRRSMVDMKDPLYDVFPDYLEAESVQADLEPGDVLLLPAFWFHYVSYKDFCISVSFLTAARERVQLYKVYDISIPFKDYKQQSREMIEVVRLFLLMIAEDIVGEDQAPLYINQFVDVHWAPAAASLLPEATMPLDFYCYRSSRNKNAEAEQKVRQWLAPTVHQIADIFNNKDMNMGSRDIMFGKYMADLANMAVGEDNAILFFLRCF